MTPRVAPMRLAAAVTRDGRATVRRALALGAMAAMLSTPPLAGQQKVPLVLHHLVIVLDSGTWHDVSTAPLLREQFAANFPHLSGRTLAVELLGLIGKYNYFVFAAPHAALARQPGDVDIVVASEKPGAFDVLSAGGGYQRETVSSESETSWGDLSTGYEVLRLAGPDSTSDHARFSIIQYTSNSARQAAVKDSLPISNLAISRFLASRYAPGKLLAYVTSATLAIPVDDIAKITRVLQGDGVIVFAEGEGAIIKLDGFTLHLIPPWAGSGVKQLQFALTRDVPANPVYSFGPRSQLRFGPGPIAVWDFGAR